MFPPWQFLGVPRHSLAGIRYSMPLPAQKWSWTFVNQRLHFLVKFESVHKACNTILPTGLHLDAFKHRLIWNWHFKKACHISGPIELSRLDLYKDFMYLLSPLPPWYKSVMFIAKRLPALFDTAFLLAATSIQNFCFSFRILNSYPARNIVTWINEFLSDFYNWTHIFAM